jgi:thiol:disulfide interchange protein
VYFEEFKVIKVFIGLLSLLFLVSASAQQPQYVDLGAEVIKIDGKSILAVSFKNDEKWHTYWKNPGDAGLSIKLRFYQDEKLVKLNDHPWPTPQRYIEKGNMWAYGYGGTYAMYFDLNSSFKDSSFKIVGEWLVCRDICIPGTRTVKFNINQNLNGSVNSLLVTNKLIKGFKALPVITKSESPVKIFLNKGADQNELSLDYIIEDVDFSKVSPKSNILTPYHAFPFDYKHEYVYYDRENKMIYGRMPIEWDGIYEDPIWEMPENGTFKKPLKTRFLIQYPNDKAPLIITKEFTHFSLTGFKSISQKLDSLEQLGKTAVSEEGSPRSNSESIWKYIFFAFLGGLILNLMPCVLPVISIKLFGLISHSDKSRGEIFKHNLFYSIGVLLTFGILAAVVHLLKENGEVIGWGFQLQSPSFVFIMILILLVMAMNMLGLFEFITPGGKTLGGSKVKEGFSGDILNGVLATILSTPCSAPFLGSALPFAFASSTLNIYLIFLSIGLGLAFPFILTGIFPVMIKLLPKPGAWMDKLKKLLGLSLLLTAVWLYDVLFSIVDISVLGILVNAFLALLFFAFYFRKHFSKKLFTTFLVFLIPILLFYKIMVQISLPDSELKESTSIAKQGDLQYQNWSVAKMKSIRKENKNTFIYFTAKWCLTCKVNEKLVLKSDEFKQLAKENNLGLLKGDWTKRDDNITKFLAKHNIYGVPAYFVLQEDGKIISLGETISVDAVRDNLK